MSGLRLLFRCLFRGMFHSGNHFRGGGRVEPVGVQPQNGPSFWTLQCTRVHQSTLDALVSQGVHLSTLEYTGVHWNTSPMLSQCRSAGAEREMCYFAPRVEQVRVRQSTLDALVSHGVHLSTLEYTGVHWNTLEYTGVHWSTLEYTGVH